MSAVATKPRAAKRASPPAAKGPAIVFAEILKALEHARGLVLGADKAAGEEGDSGSTLLFYAQQALSKALTTAAPQHSAMNDLIRVVFDIQAFVQGCAAMHIDDGRGLLALQADSVLEPLHAVMDAPGFWPKEPQPAPAPPADAPMTQAPEPAPAEDSDAARRFALARAANFEMGKLAEAVIKLLDIKRDDDFPMYHGILQRICLLSEINFQAMQLHGDEDALSEWGDDAKVQNMERAYKGLYR